MTVRPSVAMTVGLCLWIAAGPGPDDFQTSAFGQHEDHSMHGGSSDGEDIFEMSLDELLDVQHPSMTNVMGGHVHGSGEWMPMFRFTHLEMDGLRDGTSSVSDAEVLQSYPVTPVEMTTEMVMLGIMAAPTDKFTVHVMLPYKYKSMKHQTRMGGRFTTRAKGFGDLVAEGIYLVHRTDDVDVLVNLGLSIPTGSVDETDDTTAGANQKLPYAMQIGSGSFDVKPGVTYRWDGQDWAWGAQGTGVLRLNDNSEDYRLGNELHVTVWVDRKWTETVSTSIRAIGRAIDDIHGADPDLNPMIVPTADPDRYGGERVDLALGVEKYFPDGPMESMRFTLEFGMPVYQRLRGPQLSADWWAALAWTATY